MSWTTPKTDWTEADRCTAADINRINSNVEYLLTHGEPEHTYTTSDIVTIGAWREIINKAISLAAMVGRVTDAPDERATHDNFNRLETLISDLKQPVDLRYKQSVANRYSGQIRIGSRNYTGGKK